MIPDAATKQRALLAALVAAHTLFWLPVVSGWWLLLTLPHAWEPPGAPPRRR